jgi:hypothetical protein
MMKSISSWKVIDICNHVANSNYLARDRCARSTPYSDEWPMGASTLVMQANTKARTLTLVLAICRGQEYVEILYLVN